MTDVRERVRSADQPRKSVERDPYRTTPPKPRGPGFAPVIFIVILLGAAAYFFDTQNTTVNVDAVAPVERTL
jgi:hypothetical protein